MTTRFADHILSGTHAARPAATAVPDGTIYACSDHDLIYQSDGAVWATWLSPSTVAALNDLSDVDTTGQASGNVLTYDGADWVPQAPSAGGAVAIVFKGVGGQYISVPTDAAFDIASPSKFTVRMWAMPLASNVNNGLATRSALGGSQGDWALGFFNGASMRPTFRVNNNAASVQSATTLSPGEWYFLEASYDSSLGSNNLKLFIDGVLDVQGNYSTVITNNANPIRVGTYFDASSWFSGYISEFEFCAGVVRNTSAYTPPAQITADANTTIHWSFDEYFGAGVTDDSGNGFNGSIVSPSDYNTYFRKL